MSEEIARINKHKFEDSIRIILRAKAKSQQISIADSLELHLQKQKYQKSVVLDTHRKAQAKTKLSICNFQLSPHQAFSPSKKPLSKLSLSSLPSPHLHSSDRHLDRKVLLKIARIHQEEKKNERVVEKEDQQSNKRNNDSVNQNKEKEINSGNKIKIRRRKSLDTLGSLMRESMKKQNGGRFSSKNSRQAQLPHLNSNRAFNSNSVPQNRSPNFYTLTFDAVTQANSLQSNKNKTHYLEPPQKETKNTSFKSLKNVQNQNNFQSQDFKPIKKWIQYPKKGEQVYAIVMPEAPPEEEISPLPLPGQATDSYQNEKYFYISNLKLQTIQTNQNRKQQEYQGTRKNWNLLHQKKTSTRNSQAKTIKPFFNEGPSMHKEENKKFRIRVNQKQSDEELIIKQENMLSGWYNQNEEEHTDFLY